MLGSSWTGLVQSGRISGSCPEGVVSRKSDTEPELVVMANRVGLEGWKWRSKTAVGRGIFWICVLFFFLLVFFSFFLLSFFFLLIC